MDEQNIQNLIVVEVVDGVLSNIFCDNKALQILVVDREGYPSREGARFQMEQRPLGEMTFGTGRLLDNTLRKKIVQSIAARS